MRKTYHVYILTNKNNTVLYTGVTGDIIQRIWQYKNGLTDGFAKKYNVDKLIYLEEYSSIHDAIDREKQLKAGSRQKKLDLINEMNSGWKDLYDDLFP